MYTWEFKEFAAVCMGLLRKLHVLLTKPNIFCYPAPFTRIRIFLIRIFFFADSTSVHTYPGNLAYESATFWIRSPEWKFSNTLRIRNLVDAKSGYIFIQWRHKIEPSSLPWIFNTVPSAVLSFLYLLDFSFKSYKVCSVKTSYDYCTLQLWQTATRHFEAPFYVRRTSSIRMRVDVEIFESAEKTLGIHARRFETATGKENFLVQIWSLGFQI